MNGPAPDLRAAIDQVIDAIDTGCTPAEVRASAEYLRGEHDRTTQH